MKRLRLGVIGVSGHLMRRMILPMMQSESVELIALASRDLEKAQAAAGQWNVPRAYDSYEALLADEDVEAVYIPLPNHMHLEWIKKCVDAGKHVLCEKPLTLNAEEVKELEVHMDGKEVKVMEAFMYRFHPKWQAVRELMMTSAIGKVQSIHTVFSYSNRDPKNIRNVKDYGGGALMDIGCYAISSARWILDKEPFRVMGLNSISDDFCTDILSSGILDFGDARCVFSVSTDMFAAQEVKVYGTGGTLEVKIPFNDPHDVPGQVVVKDGVSTRTIEFEPTNQYGEMFHAFAEAIRYDDEVPVPLKDSYYNMRIIDQLLLSGETGQWEKI